MTKVGPNQLDEQQAWQGDIEDESRTDPGELFGQQADPFEQYPQTDNTEDRRGNRNGKAEVTQHSSIFACLRGSGDSSSLLRARSCRA